MEGSAWDIQHLLGLWRYIIDLGVVKGSQTTRLIYQMSGPPETLPRALDAVMNFILLYALLR